MVGFFLALVCFLGGQTHTRFISGVLNPGDLSDVGLTQSIHKGILSSDPRLMYCDACFGLGYMAPEGSMNAVEFAKMRDGQK
jgi:hypothetical protein